MERYLGWHVSGEPFAAYSLSHGITLAIAVGLVLALYLFRERLRGAAANRIVRWGLAAVLLGSELLLQAWYWYNGVWSFVWLIPFELCSISLWICFFMLARKSYSLYEIVYFTGIGGAAQAMLTPVLFHPFPHFRFTHFFIAHIAIILAPLFMTWVEGFRPTWRSVWKSFGLLNLIALVVYVVNQYLGTNFMFLAYKPETGSILDLLGPHPWYILSLEGVVLFFFCLLYLPYAVADWRAKRRERAAG
ncbi:YwaF family protein [Brevibacillus dissolubilis]|uniref:YwaF family protein n=1 Tax=Brevibacillus dissolubilis TaxID=1844116 RepID=UPI0011176A0F|nr:TIGR02206 family membrane protein [Brevibacillus dissolubilis]